MNLANVFIGCWIIIYGIRISHVEPTIIVKRFLIWQWVEIIEPSKDEVIFATFLSVLFLVFGLIIVLVSLDNLKNELKRNETPI